MGKIHKALNILVAAACIEVNASVVINEVQSSNSSTFRDENGEYPDWVELYNDGQEEVDLSGWGLSDKATKPFKWTFPEGTAIEGGGYLCVFADSVEEPPQEPDPIAPDQARCFEDLVCWLQADDALATCSGTGDVALWMDRSSFQNDATNPDVSTQPKVVGSVANGHAALRFESDKVQLLDLPVKGFKGLESFSNATVMVVHNWSGSRPPSGGGRGLIGLSRNESESSLLFEYDGGGRPKVSIGSGAEVVNCRMVSYQVGKTWQILSFTTDSNRETDSISTLFMDRDKTVMQTQNFTMEGLQEEDGRLTVGTSNPYSGRSFDGYIAEILIFRRKLTDDEYAHICKWLEVRYGIVHATKLHSNFSLSNDGEDLTLTPRGAAEPCDKLTFGFIPDNKTFGRTSDGSMAYFANPTPGAKNHKTSYTEVLAPVQFSETRGIRTEAFSLELSHEDTGATIVYTTDHSEPTESNGLVYRAGESILVSNTAVVRATAFKPGALPYRNVVTHSYIFLDNVFSQDASEDCSDMWEDKAKACYSISKSVIVDEATSNEFVAALKAAPIVSITLPNANLFNAQTGLYGGKNASSEFAASVEWVTGDDVFGLDAGLKISGAGSRGFNRTPKKSLRVVFRGKYGAGKLKRPVLKAGGYDGEEYNTLVFRGEHNYSWHAIDSDSRGSYGTSMRDQFVRDVQNRMSGFSAAGTHVHLFLNGLYWGLYNVCERPDAESAALRFGGTSSDYIVMKYGTGGIEARDGDSFVYRQTLLDLFEQDISSREGLESVGAVYDIDAFIDYMLLQYYSGNVDWPNNNWVVAGAPEKGINYRFFVWDAECAYIKTASDVTTAAANSWWTPQKLQRFLEGSEEYRLLFADHVQKHLFQEGVLTDENLSANYANLAQKVRPLVFAESARWGAYYHDNVSVDWPVFGMEHWDAEYNRLIKDYFPVRKEVFLKQLKKIGLYPNVDAPGLARGEDAKTVELSIPTGAAVYYTTNGADPRVPYEGVVAASAVEYHAGDVITATDSVKVRARARLADGTWSALTETDIEASDPKPVQNVFLKTKNGENWDKDANWSLGRYPNGAGEVAVIGIPTEFKADKGWRNIHINKNNVTIGHVEIENGGCTNRIDTGKSGNFVFCGDTNELGEVVSAATFVVKDVDNPGLAMIDLDEPNMVSLRSDVEFVVSNEAGDVAWGGMLCKGAWAGNGHDLKKLGKGRMTIDFSCAAGFPAFDKIQVAEGTLAIARPICAGALTQDGNCWVKGFCGSLTDVTNVAVVCAEKVSVDGPCLFIPTFNGGKTFYGGFVAPKLPKVSKCKVYVRDDVGTVYFGKDRWVECNDAKVSTAQLPDGRLTYSVVVPQLVPDPPSFSPSTQTSIEVFAASESDAMLKVALTAPEGADGDPVIDANSYAEYFNLSATPGESAGSYVVSVELNPEAVDADESVHSLSESLSSVATLPKGESCDVIVVAKPGLFYSVLTSSDLVGWDACGSRKLAVDRFVELQVPGLGSSSGFYKIRVTHDP